MNKKSNIYLKEIEENHNHSLFEEIFERREKDAHKTALFYRGKKIKYSELKTKVYEYAKALKENGIKKGDEIPICMSNTPEFVYLIGAISLIGAQANVFGASWDKDYITEIINECNTDLIFVTDDLYAKIEGCIKESKVKNIIVSSLTDSLPNKKNPYIELESKWYDFKDRSASIVRDNENARLLSIFIESGKKYTGQVEEKVDLNDIYTTTYSSGSTNSSRPKGIVHDVKSYVVMGTFHDPEKSNVPSMRNLRMLAHIPPHSNTDIQSCITDPLMQGTEVALEPIYNEEHYIYSLLINKPSFVTATRSFFLKLADDILYNKKYKNVKMPFLLVPMIVGEPTSPGEEKYINKCLRKINAGSKYTHLPISPITVSIAGGDCEHGGLFFILFKALQEKKLKYLLGKEQKGLRTYNMVEVVALRENGEHCEPGEIGRLGANSPCTMICYKNDPEATEQFFMKDVYGKTWGDCSVYGYIDRYSDIHMKGRIESKDEIPPFQIADIVLKDTKNILSCEVIKVDSNYVIHFRTMPDKKIKDTRQIILSINNRCLKYFDKKLVDKFIYKERTTFPLTGCGKRNNLSLKEEEIPLDSLVVKNNAVMTYCPKNVKKREKKLL